MEHEVIIAEKGSAAEKIAKALSDGYLEPVEKRGVFFYKIERGEKKIIVVPAVGHIFGLKQATKGSKYPYFKTMWAPTFEIKKRNEYARKYYENMKEVCESSSTFTVATDFDQEGSVIGYNIIKFLCKKENAKRMKFSTLTKEELNNSYDNAKKSLDFGMINSGLARHELDWYYGINLSRGLTHAIKSTGKVFAIISIGRVQGPMLSFLAQREKEIGKFVPTPFWQVSLKIEVCGKELEAMHKEKKLLDEKIAKKIVSDCKNKDATVESVKKTETKKKPPHPFNLTNLQTEAYNLFGYSPKQTVDLAQTLYSKAYISYPRTSSQKLPKQLDLPKIISKLSEQTLYKKLCKELLKKKELIPNEGGKKDPAHPALHPTGEKPKNLVGPKKKIYDLIVKRFLATFAEPAIRESMSISLVIGEHEFKMSGSRTIKANWLDYYKPYAKFQEISFPELKKGGVLKNKSVLKIDKETSPPPRFSQGSILKELEAKSIGTKATRAQILQTLYYRGYIQGKSIEVTEFGMVLIETLKKHCPEIVSEKLTRKFEKEMEKIYEKKIEKEKILRKARKVLTKILNKMIEEEKEIGDMLDDALIKKRKEEREFGPCPNCGQMLKVLFSPTTKKRFVGCSGYPECKTGFPIPLKGLLKKTSKICEKCNCPIIYVYRTGKRPFKMCLDPNCPTKEGWNKNKKKTKTSETEAKGPEHTNEGEKQEKNEKTNGA